MENLQPFNRQILEIGNIQLSKVHLPFVVLLACWPRTRCVLTCFNVYITPKMNSGSYPQLPSGAPGESISFFFGSFWPSAAAAMPAPILPVSVPTPSNSGKPRFVGIPYQRCNYPACCWVGCKSKSYEWWQYPLVPCIPLLRNWLPMDQHSSTTLAWTPHHHGHHWVRHHHGHHWIGSHTWTNGFCGCKTGHLYNEDSLRNNGKLI